MFLKDVLWRPGLDDALLDPDVVSFESCAVPVLSELEDAVDLQVVEDGRVDIQHKVPLVRYRNILSFSWQSGLSQFLPVGEVTPVPVEVFSFALSL